jgi:GNAT superfamily N-acetyltransferase
LNSPQPPFATIPQPRPDGTLQVTVTYLQMTRPPSGSLRRSRADDLIILRAREPTVAFYRFLYNHVGEPWLWYERRALADNALAAILNDSKVHVYVLYRSGVPAGYVELDYRVSDEVELAYFGLFPEQTGMGLGPWLLGWALETAWASGPSRLIVNTCNLDHPKAIIVYQRAGFSPYRQETCTMTDPRNAPFWNQPPANSP